MMLKNANKKSKRRHLRSIKRKLKWMPIELSKYEKEYLAEIEKMKNIMCQMMGLPPEVIKKFSSPE